MSASVQTFGCAAAGGVSSEPVVDGCQISLEKWVKIVERIENADFLAFCGHRLSGSHVRAAQCRALASVALCTPETARLWLTGASHPCWQSMLAVFHATRRTFGSDDEMRAALGAAA